MEEMPLSGVKVVDLSWVMVGPTVARYLADSGATVIHVESTLRVDTARTLPPFKDGLVGHERSAFFASVNANKLGLSLNLAKPQARDLVLSLVSWADVLIESFTPRVMRSWHLGYENLVKINPGLIMVSTCLNGQTGPDAEAAGYGNLAAALTGFGDLVGWAEADPAGPFGAYTDYVAPRFIAATLLAALDYRRRTGQGQYIDSAQAEAAVHFLAPAILEYTAAGRLPKRMGNRSLEAVPHGVYRCRGEDKWVALAVSDENQWGRFCHALGRQQWLKDPRFATAEARRAHEAALEELIESSTVEKSAEEIEKLMQDVGVAAHAVLSPGDMIGEAQLGHRGHFVEVSHPEVGRVPVERSRFICSRGDRTEYTAGPVYGQHNDLVLKEILGLGEEEIAKLRASDAIK